MVFNYAVKHNGIDYKPGEDVPIEDVSPVKKDTVIEEKTAEKKTSVRGRKSKKAE